MTSSVVRRWALSSWRMRLCAAKRFGGLLKGLRAALLGVEDAVVFCPWFATVELSILKMCEMMVL